MIWSWFKSRRRKKLMAAAFPAAWEKTIRRNVRYEDLLLPEQQAQLRKYVQVFVAEKNWEGCGGQEMNDEVQVTISALVAILVAGIDPPYYFDPIKSILVYPSTYVLPKKHSGGLLVEENVEVLGEAWDHGTVILAWDSVLEGARHVRTGHNVVFHEFAHCLDGVDGTTDGTPPLRDRQQQRQWREITDQEFHRLQRDSELGRATLLDTYGATNKAEFFAVATECFFELGPEMKEYHPKLYDALARFYMQDTAER